MTELIARGSARSHKHASDVDVPDELKLKQDQEFVARVAESLERSRRKAKKMPDAVAKLHASLMGVVEAPNTCLARWVELVTGDGTTAHLEAVTVDPKLKVFLARQANGCCNKCWRTRWCLGLKMVEAPIMQVLLLSLLLQSVVTNQIDWAGGQDLCIPMEGGGTLHVLKITFIVMLFRLGVIEMRSEASEWQVISFLSSLRFDAYANVLLYLCSVLEQVAEALYSTTLYVILVSHPDWLDCVLNCLALTFIMQLDNMMIKISPRLQASASHTLGEMVAQVEYTDLVIFHAGPRRRWAPWALHRLGPRAAAGMILIYNLIYSVNLLMIFVFVVFFVTCSTVSMKEALVQNWNVVSSVSGVNGTIISTDIVATLGRSWTQYMTMVGPLKLYEQVVLGPIEHVYPPAPPEWRGTLEQLEQVEEQLISL